MPQKRRCLTKGYDTWWRMEAQGSRDPPLGCPIVGSSNHIHEEGTSANKPSRSRKWQLRMSLNPIWIPLSAQSVWQGDQRPSGQPFSFHAWWGWCSRLWTPYPCLRWLTIRRWGASFSRPSICPKAYCLQFWDLEFGLDCHPHLTRQNIRVACMQ